MSTETLVFLERFFPPSRNDSYSKIVSAVVNKTIKNEGPQGLNTQEAVLYEMLLRDAVSSTANEDAQKQPKVEVAVEEKVVEPVYKHRNILCSEEDRPTLMCLLNNKSDRLNPSDRKILMALVKQNHRWNKNLTPDDPVSYSNRKCDADLNCHESERAHLLNVLGCSGILERGIRKIGTLENGNDMVTTAYWLDEPALLRFLTTDPDEYGEEIENKMENAPADEAPIKFNAELVYTTTGGAVKHEEELSDVEQTMLYYLNEASQKRENKLRLGSRKFTCKAKDLQRYIGGSESVKKTRESLVKKGYIEAKMTSTQIYRGYVFRILKYPEYLNNKAS